MSEYTSVEDLELAHISIILERKKLERQEIDLFQEALRRTSGNKTQAGKLLGLSRYAVKRRLRRKV